MTCTALFLVEIPLSYKHTMELTVISILVG